jgi:hypothetical protein
VEVGVVVAPEEADRRAHRRFGAAQRRQPRPRPPQPRGQHAGRVVSGQHVQRGRLPEAHRGQAFGLAMTGTMTLQGLSMAGAGALAEVLAPGTVMALAGAASITATLTLWPKLRAR